MEISQRIAAIRDTFHLNNFSFSKRIGVTGTTIDSIVNGRPQPDGSRKRTKPGYDVLTAIINEFDINPDYLFGKSEVMLTADTNKTQTYSGIPQVVSVNATGNENVRLFALFIHDFLIVDISHMNIDLNILILKHKLNIF